MHVYVYQPSLRSHSGLPGRRIRIRLADAYLNLQIMEEGVIRIELKGHSAYWQVTEGMACHALPEGPRVSQIRTDTGCQCRRQPLSV